MAIYKFTAKPVCPACKADLTENNSLQIAGYPGYVHPETSLLMDTEYVVVNPYLMDVWCSKCSNNIPAESIMDRPDQPAPIVEKFEVLKEWEGMPTVTKGLRVRIIDRSADKSLVLCQTLPDHPAKWMPADHLSQTPTMLNINRC